jgi:hypothetical protein
VDTPVTLKVAGFEAGYPEGSFLWILNNIYFQYYGMLIFVICTVVLIAVSYATEAASEKQITDLTYGTMDRGAPSRVARELESLGREFLRHPGFHRDGVPLLQGVNPADDTVRSQCLVLRSWCVPGAGCRSPQRLHPCASPAWFAPLDAAVAPSGDVARLLTREAAYAAVQALRSPVQVSGPPRDRPWGEKSFLLTDPDGNRWAIAQSPSADGMLTNR